MTLAELRAALDMMAVDTIESDDDPNVLVMVNGEYAELSSPTSLF